MRWIVAAIAVWLTATGLAVAQESTQQSAILREIRETANDICDKVSQQGQHSETKLSGDIEAKVNGAIRRFADLGIRGAAELQNEQHSGVLQPELATVLMHTADCRKDVFDQLAKRLLPREPVEPPTPLPHRIIGWLVTFGAKEQGGGAFRQFPSRTCVVKTPAAIDIRGLLPAGLSSRNVFIPMTATTNHQVVEAGRWVYYLKINGTPTSYTQCMTFEVQSDGVQIGGGQLPILMGTSSTADTSAPVGQSMGMHTVTIKLACYFQGGQFPAISLMLKPPSGRWRTPTSGDFTVEQPVQTDKPPSAASNEPCID